MANCPVCELPVPEGPFNSGGRRVSCRRCGEFAISDDALEDLPALIRRKNARPLLSHFIRKMAAGSGRPKITSVVATQIVEQESLPNPAEQADNLILALGADTADDPGKQTYIDPYKFMARVGASSPDGLNYVVGQAVHCELINGRWHNWNEANGTNHMNGQLLGRLSLAGWARFESLRRSGGTGTRAFLAMKFGDEELDEVVVNLRTAAQQTGFTVRRLDDEPRAGLIDDRLRVEIRQARFLLADLTHANNGAYWEAGYAEGLGKPVFYLCKRSVFETLNTHFDTNHQLTILWDLTTIDEDMERLKATIRFSIPEAKQSD